MLPIEQAARDFLEHVYRQAPPTSSRPRITLTFAQSIDGKIAGAHREQVAISGMDSLKMTHMMRTMNTGILVGIGTLLNDNPQLNARQLSEPPPVSGLPQPIILDSDLRLPLDSKVVQNASAGTGKAPCLLYTKQATDSELDALRKAHCEPIPTAPSKPSTSSHSDRWPQIFAALQPTHTSLMIEGGAQVISSLLQKQDLIDVLIITVGKTMLGPQGVAYDGAPLMQMKHVATREFGSDTVIAFVKSR